jgi:hypothetical protein
MAKIPTIYTFPHVTPVAFRKGVVAKIARWLHKRMKSRFLYNLGYEEIEVLDTPQVIGVVTDTVDGVIKVQINPVATVEVYPHRYNEN